MNIDNFISFYHPTMVYFMDDNKNFLNSLELDFADKIRMQTFDNHMQFLDALNNNEEDIDKLVLNYIEEYTPVDKLMNVNLKNLHKLIYDDCRFSYVSVVVVDYSMPEMNGIELCKQISNKNVFKIMLTAEAGKNIAVEAFNAGVIDKFLMKDDADLNTKLLSYINELQEKYFFTLSKEIKHAYEKDLLGIVTMSQYNKIFNDVRKNSNAIEFYLLDKFGSFLFLDANGNPIWLVLRSRSEMDDWAMIAKEENKYLYDLLKTGSKLLFQLTIDDLKTPFSEWSKYLYDTTKLTDNYYYAIIEGKTNNNVDWDKAFFLKNCE